MNSRDRRHKPKPVHVPPELFKLVSPDRSARITHCRLRLTIGLARTEGRQRSNSAHRARRRIDAFTATEDRLPPLDSIAHPPGARPGINKSPNRMAWRPYENLIDGELDNRTPGKVTGWMRFFRKGKHPLKVTFDLEGDFHDDIRGTLIRLSNPNPSDRNDQLGRSGSYVDGIARVQRGTVGDITAGLPLGPWTEELAQKLMAQHELAWGELGTTGEKREAQRQELSDRYRRHIEAGDVYYAYVAYPYIEWDSDNGRGGFELYPSQLGNVKATRGEAKNPAGLHQEEKKRSEAFGSFMAGMVDELSEENREKGGDGKVTGIVVG